MVIEVLAMQISSWFFGYLKMKRLDKTMLNRQELWATMMICQDVQSTLFVPHLALAKAGNIEIYSSICQSLYLSVTKTLTWLISSEVLMIERWYLACMIIETSPFNWHHSVTLTFDLFQGKICCLAGDHNSLNSLVTCKCLCLKEFAQLKRYQKLHIRPTRTRTNTVRSNPLITYVFWQSILITSFD